MSALFSPNEAAPGIVRESGDLRDNIIGGLVQLTQFASLAVLNIILPRVLGPQGFGLAASVLAIPYAVYAIAERPILNAAIRSTRQVGVEVEKEGALAASARDVLSLFMFLTILWFLSAEYLSELLGVADARAARVASAIFAPMGLNALLFASMYAERRTTDALRANLLHGLTLNVASLLFCVVFGLGPIGMVLGVLIAQLVCAAFLLRSSRWVLPSLLRWSGIRSSDVRRVRLDYAGAIPAPLTDVVLTSLLVPMVGAFLSLEVAATYKIAMSMVIAGATVTPISLPVAQATIARRWLESDRVHRVGRYLMSLGLLAALLGLAALVVVYVAGGWLVGLLFGRDFPMLLGALKVLVLAQVPLVIVRVLTAFFLGSGHPRLLASLNVGTGAFIVFAVALALLRFKSVLALTGAVALGLLLSAILQVIAAARVLQASVEAKTKGIRESSDD